MIYIVIPVHNRISYTKAILESLKSQTFKDYEIIIVDDGSTDGTQEMIAREYSDTILIQGKGNLWWAGAVNKGIEYMLRHCQRDDFLLTLNNDLIVGEQYLDNLNQAARQHQNAIIGSVETTMDKPDIIKNGGILINWKNAKVTILNRGVEINPDNQYFVKEVSEINGRGTLFPYEVFRKVGLFDDKYIRQCADTELTIKASIKYGYKLLVCYGAIVISQVDDKTNINAKDYYNLKDFYSYFFDTKSHANLLNRYHLARNVAPNVLWFIRYFTFSMLRLIGRFFLRLRIG